LLWAAAVGAALHGPGAAPTCSVPRAGVAVQRAHRMELVSVCVCVFVCVEHHKCTYARIDFELLTAMLLFIPYSWICNLFLEIHILFWFALVDLWKTVYRLCNIVAKLSLPACTSSVILFVEDPFHAEIPLLANRIWVIVSLSYFLSINEQ
jgi:hypothetical protein